MVPGLVGDDLLNEHLSRYRFARRFVPGNAARVLDAGCGTGYGSAEFGEGASVVALDLSDEALGYAAGHFGRPGIRFVRGSCEALPFADGTFDLVAAFEVIEHLPRWRNLLTEARRVLKPTGLLVVSTPNKAYYTESRGESGPNPFHTHEFEFEEYRDALGEVFPHVAVWTQNHAEAIVFAPVEPNGVAAEAEGDTEPEAANFFVAVCGAVPIGGQEVYAWVPRAGNVLRERERHVRKLEGELAKKEAWLRKALGELGQLQVSHEATLEELERQNRWADRLDEDLSRAWATVAGLQAEAESRLGWISDLKQVIRDLEHEVGLRDESVEQYRRHVGLLEARIEEEGVRSRETVLSYAAKVAELEGELGARTAWALSIEGELATRTRHVELLAEQVADHEAHLARQRKAISAHEQRIRELRERQLQAADSKWLRLGRKLGVGPDLSETAVHE